jgi:hypothetical protein
MMKRGANFLLSTMAVATAACGSEQAKLEVRSIPTPLAQGARPVPFRIAEARGQLALGNVALALESFRKALRDDPNSIDALAGMATCYDRMGRFDLSRRNYEAALAIAPSNVELLGAFAQSLQLQGEMAEAQSVRAEIAQRLAAGAAAETPQLLARAPSPAPAPQIAAQELAPAPMTATIPTALTASAEVVADEAVLEIPIPRPALAPTPIQVEGKTTAARLDVSAPALPDQKIVMEPDAPASAASPQPVSQVAAAPSVTIKLPPARRVEAAAPLPAPAAAPHAPVASAAVADLPPLRLHSSAVPGPAVVGEPGPRLERLSMGEIGLITAPGPVWRTTMVARSDVSTKLRFVPLRQASAYPVRVRLLNAARVDRLAARTRNWLVARGWRGMAIGDARAMRTRSVVYYPAAQRVLAQRLAAQFGFALATRSSGSQITVLLGSDAARHPALRSRRA